MWVEGRDSLQHPGRACRRHLTWGCLPWPPPGVSPPGQWGSAGQLSLLCSAGPALWGSSPAVPPPFQCGWDLRFGFNSGMQQCGREASPVIKLYKSLASVLLSLLKQIGMMSVLTERGAGPRPEGGLSQDLQSCDPQQMNPAHNHERWEAHACPFSFLRGNCSPGLYLQHGFPFLKP